ncbi:DUF3667 domain-containing protein [Flavobacteriaceae bacterium TP-CH-4]|uniref:DUF3667 domain-containing protein n=1 Tax=Pelagihabitans pacificus TaxID=2696054 RepID=A0A967EEX9_9FLAO|nr:DUF3667 domain-containing protein [Pelagihabitans pacificus]NHF60828.1 DUF3667 domain-containing protein [Pelagihabitans pacificus]
MTDKPTIPQKGRYQLQYRGTECLNCGHPLDMSDKYCPNCSQANSTKKLTLKDFFDEFFSSLISYDSKLLKTLSALILRPGTITRDYIDGKRASYTNPFRFLLSLAIVYFLMLSFRTSDDFTKLDKYGADSNGSFFKEGRSLSFGLDEQEAAAEINKTLDSLNVIETLEREDSLVLSNPRKYLDSVNSLSLINRFSGKRKFFNIVMSREGLDEFIPIIDKYGMDDSYGNRAAFNAANSFVRFKQRPGSFLSSLFSKLPFLIFFFLPVFALFIWLVYIRKKYNYTDHLIFSFHIQSLLFILLIIGFLVDSVFNIFVSWIFILIFAVYLYKSLRKFYGQGRFKTIVKYIFLNTIFFILATLSIAILLTGSLYTY